MELAKWHIFSIVLTAAVVLAAGCFFVFNHNNVPNKKTIVASDALAEVKNADPISIPPQKLINPPAIIKAVYVTGYSAGTKSYLNYLSNLLKNTQINAVVVDVKGSDGYVTYASGAPDVAKYNLTDYAISNIDNLVNFLHSQNIYVIGRIAVFQDPEYAKARPELAIYDSAETTDLSHPVLWKDKGGLSWLDPSSKDVWDYNISLAKDAFNHGFDEVNFDYVRFPSDGKTDNMGFPFWDKKTSMADTIKSFFNYLRTNLAGEKISVDLFGQTTTNTDDMGIGQLLENAFENFDYVCPMIYPSHYINGFLGFANPADHPYDIVKNAVDNAVTREDNFKNNQQDLSVNSGAVSADSPPIAVPLAKLRPWLQDFNLGAVYSANMVKEEIGATQDALGNNFNGFMLWNAANVYTQDAVKNDNPSVAQ